LAVCSGSKITVELNFERYWPAWGWTKAVINYGRFIEFDDVDMRIDWLDGIWNFSGILDSSCGIRDDAPPATAGRGEGPARSGTSFLSYIYF
jgi:hypothetical protein